MLLMLLAMVGGLGWFGWTGWKSLNKVAEEKYGYRPNCWEWTLALGAAEFFLFRGLTMIHHDPMAAFSGVVLGVVLFGVTYCSIAHRTNWDIALGSVVVQAVAAICALLALFLIVMAIFYVAVRIFGADDRRVVIVRER